MRKHKSKFIAGLLSPQVLRKAERNPLGVEAGLAKQCSVLEIRYDLFDETEWGSLPQRVLELSREALRLGTVRLERDGGAFKNERAAERKNILALKDLDWIDIERGEDFSWVKQSAKVIYSWHLFDRVPSERELNDFAQECLDLKAQGCKVAAMAHAKSDADVLYSFAKKYGKSFELFSAFAMGEQGKESRMRSLTEGANLTYASIGEALAPGQLNIRDFFLDSELEKSWK